MVLRIGDKCFGVDGAKGRTAVFTYNYHCRDCDAKLLAFQGMIGYYLFADGERLPAPTRLVWCNACATITLAENLHSPTDLEVRLEQLEQGMLSDDERQFVVELNGTLEDDIQSAITIFRTMIRRFRDRKTSNRCIDCGTTSFVTIECDGALPKAFTHPGCHGTLTQTGCAISSQSTYFMLDVDGNRIPAPQ